MRANKQLGFTLIEMMISLVVASFIAVAAVGVVFTVSKQKKRAADKFKLLTNNSSVLGRIVPIINKAGVHFPSSAYGIRVHDNVGVDNALSATFTSTASFGSINKHWLNSAQTNDVCGGSGWHLKSGEDAIVAYFGDLRIPSGTASPQILPQPDSLVSSAIASVSPRTYTIVTNSGFAPALNSRLLIAGSNSGAEERCLVKVIQTAPNAVVVSMIDQDGQDLDSSPTGGVMSFNGAPINLSGVSSVCMSAQANVWTLSHSVRFFVCTEDTAPANGGPRATRLQWEYFDTEGVPCSSPNPTRPVPCPAGLAGDSIPDVESLQVAVGVKFRGYPTSVYWPARQAMAAFDQGNASTLSTMLSVPPGWRNPGVQSGPNFYNPGGGQPVSDTETTSANPWQTRTVWCGARPFTLGAHPCILWDYLSPGSSAWASDPGAPLKPAQLLYGTNSTTSVDFWAGNIVRFSPLYPVEQMTPRERVRELRIAVVTRKPVADSDDQLFEFPFNHPTRSGPFAGKDDDAYSSVVTGEVKDKYQRGVDYETLELPNFEVKP